MTRVEYLFIYWVGGIIWDWGGNFSKFIYRGSYRVGTQEDLDRVYEWNLLSEVFVGSKIKEVIREEKMEKTKARKELK